MEPHTARRRHDHMTAFMRSTALDRIRSLQRSLPGLRDTRELVELLGLLDLTEESTHSPVRELYVLLVAEMAMVQLGVPAAVEHIPTDALLANLAEYAQLRYTEVQDPGATLEWCILDAMRLLGQARPQEALAQLETFASIAGPFGYPADREFVRGFRQAVGEGRFDVANALGLRRLETLFRVHFEEIVEGLQRKITTLQAAAEGIG